MPRIKAAKKAMRQSLKRREKNTSTKRKVHEAIKEIMKLGKTQKKSDVEKKLPEVFSLVDKAVKQGLFHKNKAARKKSQLAKMAK